MYHRNSKTNIKALKTYFFYRKTFGETTFENMVHMEISLHAIQKNHAKISPKEFQL